MTPFFHSQKCFPVLRNPSCLLAFHVVFLLTFHLIKMLTWLMFGVLFPATAVTYPCLPFVFIFHTFTSEKVLIFDLTSKRLKMRTSVILCYYSYFFSFIFQSVYMGNCSHYCWVLFQRWGVFALTLTFSLQADGNIRRWHAEWHRQQSAYKSTAFSCKFSVL